mmetsp:Transcript_20541/g.68954  ORF Transcript_20541/g.68954 Transcript_20541/m.68954 type:complete len:203 (-) Transcript_20541:107-715(-)
MEDTRSRRSWPDFFYEHIKWIVSAAAMATLVARNDTVCTICVLGAVVNALSTKVLKHTIAQARPTGAPLVDPGMPSSHASSLFYFATFIAIALRESYDKRLLAAAAALPALAFSASWYRVRSGLHTAAQVVVGALVGAAFAIAWWRMPLEDSIPQIRGRGFALGLAAFVLVGMVGYDPLERRAIGALSPERQKRASGGRPSG